MHTTPPAAELLVAHAEFVQRLARGLAGGQSGGSGDDLAQDTWVRALGAGGAHRSLRGWLAAIAGNLWRNQQRAEARRRAREAAAARPEPLPSASDIAEREEVRRRVVDAVLQLPEPLRAVVLLRFYEGLDSKAISARLQRPASTVRSQLAAALQRLRQRLDREHGDERAAWAAPLGAWSRALQRAPALLRVGFALRAAAAAVLICSLGWLALPAVFGSPPSAPSSVPTPIAGTARNGRDPATGVPGERQTLASAAPMLAHGPETLWGRVVLDADGAPIADAVVDLQFSDADQFSCLDQDYARQVATLATARTDAAGRFTFPVARARQHRLRVCAAGAAPRVEFGCTGGAEIEVRMAPGAVVEGVVRDAASGEPIGDAEVTLRWNSRGVDASVRTAGDGSFQVTDVAAASVLVQVAAPGWAGLGKRVEVPPGGTQRVELALGRGRTVRGKVLDAVAQVGIGDAEVADSREYTHSVRTRADGSYELPGVGADAQVHVRASGFAPALRVVPKDAQEVVLDFGLVHGATLRGRIVDPAGEPVPQAFVGCVVEYMLHDARVYLSGWRRAAVGADGRFVATAVPALAQELYVRAPGFGARAYSLGMHGNDESRDLGDIVMRPAAIVEGRLLDSERRPIAGAWISLYGTNADETSAFAARLLRDPVPSGATWNTCEVFQGTLFSLFGHGTQTASDGSFRFADLAGGTYRLDALLAGLRSDETKDPIAVADGEVRTGIEIVKSAANAIAGHVRAEGVALAGSQLLAQSEKGDVTNVAITADGEFEVRGAAGDTYSLIGWKLPAGYALSPCRGVRVPARDVELRLVRALPIEGRVVDAQGRGTATSVCVWFAGVQGPAMYETAADGSFTLDVAPDYVGRISVNHGGRKAAADPVAAGTRDLVLRLR
jgi:RNA polymerase sigma-70 factor (ECF subfamily)